MSGCSNLSNAWFIHTREVLKSLSFQSFDVLIDNHIIRIYFALNSKFLLLKRAFANTVSGNSKASYQPILEIYCIDNKYSSVLPPPVWALNQCNNKGYVLGLDTKNCFVQVDFLRGQLKAVNIELQFGVYYVPEENKLPAWEYYSPLKDFFHFWCLSNNKMLVHAGSLVIENNRKNSAEAILFIGRGGTGKSSTVLCGINNGWKTCGDDYLIICLIDFKIISLYSTIKYMPHFISLSSSKLSNFYQDTNPENSKKITFIPKSSRCLSLQAKLTKIMFLDKNIKYYIRPMTQSKALIHLSVSTIMQIPICSDFALKLISILVRKVDLFEYGIGYGLNNLNIALKNIEGLHGPKST